MAEAAITSAIVEFHGFKDNENRFVVKEFVVESKYFRTQLIFDAPYSEELLSSKMRRTVFWLTNRFHFMRWQDRGIPYDENLIRALCSPFKVLYTKGSEKVNFLKKFHNDVRDIEEAYTRSSGLKVTCILPQHNDNRGKCALHSAKSFYRLKFESPAKN